MSRFERGRQSSYEVRLVKQLGDGCGLVAWKVNKNRNTLRVSHGGPPTRVAVVRAGGELALPIGSPFVYDSKMRKSITVIQEKRKRGRPATGHDPMFSLRLPLTLMERIDKHAESRGESRSEVMRRFLEFGLESESPTAKPRRKRKED